MKIEVFQLTPFCTNCYVVKDSGEALVIDPGEAAPELFAALEGWTVRTVVNTHCHLDHAGGNAEVLARTGAELVCHELELPLLKGLEQQGMMFGVEATPSPLPNRFLNEGDVVRAGSMEFEVLFTPGHSPGHITLRGDGFVISGDVLFQGSIGRTDLPGGNHAQLLESIRTRLMTLPGETVVYSGHGPATTIGEERMSNPFLTGL